MRMMKIKDFKKATIFFIDQKQTITVLKNGASFTPCKHKYYTCYLPDPQIVLKMCLHLIEQGDIKISNYKINKD